MERAEVRDPADRWVFVGTRIYLGQFDCPPEHPAWTRTNRTGWAPLIAFPGTPVWIEHDEGRPFMTDRTRAVFYRPWQEYGRRLLDPRGDHCLYVTMGPSLLREALGEVDPEAAGQPDVAIRRSTGPVERRTYHLLWTVRRALKGPVAADSLRVEEALIRVLDETVRSGLAPREPAAVEGRAGTERAHRAVVEEARTVLAARFHERLTLEDLTGAVHVSPYHLARVFRRTTDTTIHAHLTDLRLRAALDHLAGGADDLARLAADLGFSHHSHLTNTFRRAFGLSPAQFRAGASRLERSEARTNLQAPYARAS